jgi:hypothetical protein
MRISAISKIPPVKILEKQVTEQVRDYLKYRGWRAIRMQRTVVPGAFQSGEPGMPDYLFLRYLPPFPTPKGAAALCLWIEFKAPGGKLREGQAEWHCRERLRGGSVWVVDDLDWFAELYEKHFAWLHSGDSAIGQMDLLAGVKK